jgi:hypothetical protein
MWDDFLYNSSLTPYGNFELLTGYIPPEIGFLSQLEGLEIIGTGLTGPLPRELGNLQKLNYM